MADAHDHSHDAQQDKDPEPSSGHGSISDRMKPIVTDEVKKSFEGIARNVFREIFENAAGFAAYHFGHFLLKRILGGDDDRSKKAREHLEKGEFKEAFVEGIKGLPFNIGSGDEAIIAMAVLEAQDMFDQEGNSQRGAELIREFKNLNDRTKAKLRSVLVKIKDPEQRKIFIYRLGKTQTVDDQYLGNFLDATGIESSDYAIDDLLAAAFRNAASHGRDVYQRTYNQDADQLRRRREAVVRQITTPKANPLAGAFRSMVGKAKRLIGR